MFRIGEVAHKGFGWIAIERIEPQTEIHNEPPLFIAPKNSSDAQIDAIVDNLDVVSRAAFDGLVGDTNGETFWRNGLGVASNALGSAHPRAGVYKNNSRINHSCSPNAIGACDHVNGEMHIQSGNNPIEPGEEITISYLTGPQNLLCYQGRRELLSVGAGGFDCRCESCNLPLEERRESDNRRDDIVQLKDTLLSMPGGTPEYLQTFACLNQLLAKESIPLIVAVGGDILRIFRKLKATAGAIPEENMDGTSRPFGEHKEDGTPSCEVCRSKESLLRCGRCKSVYYCGRLHQRKHWKKHKAVCKANESA